LTKELPPFERQDGGADEAVATPHGRFSLPVLSSIVVFGLLTFYVSLVVATQVDEILMPGRQLDTGLPQVIPGIDTNTPEHANINERINIVMLGLDIRRDEPDDMPARTDSVMILTMDPFSKTGGAFSIPRDTWVEIPDGYGGYTNDRINVVYELGEYTYKDYDGGGAGLVKDTIEHNFDIPIDNYVVLNFNNFIELIDELGGIEIDVPEYAYDPSYSDCNSCYTYPVEFLEGPEEMEGERALAYARIRASDNDFKRIERQQLVLRAVSKKAADLGTVFSNPVNLYKKYNDAVKTDISEFQIAGLADLAKQVGPDNIRTVSMADATYPCDYCPGAVLLFNEAKMEKLRDQVFNQYPVADDGAKVQILNGTEVPDLASYLASLLKGQGITSNRLSTDELKDGPLYDQTVIVDLDGKSQTVNELAAWLQLPASRIEKTADPEAEEFIDTDADVIVVLGADVDLTELESANSSLQESTTGG
jgi:polyisoprenyl-teichoic acid--peptidoglycan teichoic acid transferase